MEIEIIATVYDRSHNPEYWSKIIESEPVSHNNYQQGFVIGSKYFMLRGTEYHLNLGVLSMKLKIDARSPNQNDLRELTDALHLEGFSRTSNTPAL